MSYLPSSSGGMNVLGRRGPGHHPANNVLLIVLFNVSGVSCDEVQNLGAKKGKKKKRKRKKKKKKKKKEKRKKEKRKKEKNQIKLN